MKVSDGAKVFIKNKKLGKYLFVLRDDKLGIPDPNCWSLLGGGIKIDEEPLEALIREIKEEINIELYEIEKIDTRDFILTVDNMLYTVTGHIFFAYTKAELKNIVLKEGQRVEYFTIDEIKKEKNLSSDTLSVFSFYEKKLD